MKKLLLGGMWCLSVSVLLEGQELKSFCLVVCGVCAARGSKVKKLLLGGMWCLSVSVLLEGQE